jgi:hypothetical protein
VKRAELLAALKRAMGRRYQVEVTGPDTLAMAAYRLKDARGTVHLVNYDTAHPARNAVPGVDGAKARKATLIAPGRSGALRVSPAGGRAESAWATWRFTL